MSRKPTFLKAIVAGAIVAGSLTAGAGAAGARVHDGCRFARNNVRLFQSMLDDAHERKDQANIQYWRGMIFDAPLEVLDAC
ncbi:MAG: hypothetical protein ACKVWR_04350 [Acidimicrobiales bacterium]